MSDLPALCRQWTQAKHWSLKLREEEREMCAMPDSWTNENRELREQKSKEAYDMEVHAMSLRIQIRNEIHRIAQDHTGLSAMQLSEILK